MSVIIGSARHDENGKYTGGKNGDQLQTSSSNDTSGEVSMQDFYVHKKGWDIIRAKSADDANNIANNMKALCNNSAYGYNQGSRFDVIKNGIDSKIKGGCDCSSSVRACVKEAIGIDPGNFTTLNERTALLGTGKFTKESYTSEAELYTGDILVTKTKGHTVIVVSGKSRPNTSKSYYPKYKGSSSSIVTALLEVGEKDTSIKHRTKIAKANDIGNYAGSSSDNITMVKLLKAGKLIKA